MKIRRFKTNSQKKKTGSFFEKCGMTQVFTEDGKLIPVTVLRLLDQTKLNDNLVFVEKKIAMKKPQIKFLESKNIKDKAGFLKEYQIIEFKEGDKVFASARSIGHQFSGVMQRWNFKGGRASHGNSLSHRVMGSTGGRQDPGKVFKNKKMPGRWGFDNVTIENLLVIKVEENLLLLKGSVPGREGATVFLKHSPKIIRKEKI